MKVLIALLLAAAGLAAQCTTLPANAARYKAVDATTLAATSEMLTVQHDTTSKKVVCFTRAVVYCAVACVATVYQNGTAATSAALTINRYNAAPAPVTLAYSASNAGTGAWPHPEAYNVPAGGTFVLDLSAFYLDASTTSQNLSIGIGAVTGAVSMSMEWVEQ